MYDIVYIQCMELLSIKKVTMYYYFNDGKAHTKKKGFYDFITMQVGKNKNCKNLKHNIIVYLSYKFGYYIFLLHFFYQTL